MSEVKFTTDAVQHTGMHHHIGCPVRGCSYSPDTWNDSHGPGYAPVPGSDLRASITTNLRVYQQRVDRGTATDFDRGKRAAFMVVLSMLEPRGEATFSCTRADIEGANTWLSGSDIDEDDRR